MNEPIQDEPAHVETKAMILLAVVAALIVAFVVYVMYARGVFEPTQKLVLAYLNVYGLSPWGLPDYTRTVGRVFDPTVTLGFVFKTVLFGLAVAVIPSAAILELLRQPRRLRSNVQPGALRLLFVLLLIEASSLAVKYI